MQLPSENRQISAYTCGTNMYEYLYYDSFKYAVA
jgi:hypothetical protein